MLRKPAQRTSSKNQSGNLCSGTLSAALSLVIVSGIEIDGAEGFENAKLLAVPDILRQSGRDRLLLGLVTASAAGCLNQGVIQGQIGGHVWIITH
jgi:hypothetical protein